RALAAGRAVGRPVVALLAALDDAVAAALEPAGRRAPIARHVVPVVALLADLDLAVAADRGVRGAGERHLVRALPRAEAVARGDVECPRGGQTCRVRDGEAGRRRAVVVEQVGSARDQDVRAGLHREAETGDGALQRGAVGCVDRVRRLQHVRPVDRDRLDLDRIAARNPCIRDVVADRRLEDALPVGLAVLVAAGVAVDARLRGQREAAADLAVGKLDPPLGHARVAGATAREEQESAGERHHLAVRVAPAAGLTVLRAGVALLGALHLAVAAGFDLTGRVAPVTRDRVAVVALFAGIQVAVAAGG